MARFFFLVAAIGLCSAVAYGAPEVAPSHTSPQYITPRGADHPNQKIGTPAGSQQKNRATSGNWWTSLGGLMIVLALIVGMAALLKKHLPGAKMGLPSEAVQPLGRKLLEHRHAIHLVRCGSRILVIGSSPQGLNTLAEITDPVEVDYLSGICTRRDANSANEGFRQFLNRFRSDETVEGITEQSAENTRLRDRHEETAADARGEVVALSPALGAAHG